MTGLAEVDKFMSNMSSYIDMKEIFGIVDENSIEMIENIIEWITIFEDKKILKRKIEREYHLDEKIINRLAKKNYSGWSRLSKELLIGLKGNRMIEILMKDYIYISLKMVDVCIVRDH